MLLLQEQAQALAHRRASAVSAAALAGAPPLQAVFT